MLAPLSGCVQPADKCETKDCGKNPETPGGQPGQPIINATLPKTLFRDCKGFNLGAEIPADVASAHVPREFGPASTVPFMAYVGAIAYDCPKISIENRTLGAGAVLWTMMLVIPRNASWEGNGSSFYALDVWATNQSLVDELHKAGVPAALATIQKDEIVSLSGLTQETWEFAREGAQLRFTFQRDTEPFNVIYKAHVSFWFGNNPYQRVDIYRSDTNYKNARVEGGRIEMQGSTRFRDVFDVDQAAGYGAAYHSLNWDIENVPKTFTT